jgi:hypothetical protein
MSFAVSTPITPGAFSAADVDTQNFGEGVRRADEERISLVRQRCVGGVTAEPAHQHVVLNAHVFFFVVVGFGVHALFRNAVLGGDRDTGGLFIAKKADS